MSAVTERPLSAIRTLTGVHRETVELDEPFVDVVRRFAHLPGTVALLSGGDLDSARHHVLGVDPWLTLRGHRARTTLVDGDRRVDLDEDPFAALQRVLRHVTLPADDSLPLTGGLLGYLAYDLKDCLEDLPRTSVDDLGLPLMHLVAPTVLLVHDRVTATTTLLVMRLQDDDDAAVARRVGRFTAALHAPAPGPAPAPQPAGPGTSVFTRSEYLAAVEAIRAYIVEGDVYQVNMSQRFQAPFTADPFDRFATMLAANPAPFFAYVDAGDHQVVSTSPERFLRLRDGTVETRPIKGTRPRGATPAEDDLLRAELRESPKEDAELSMIVDLLRNDIGKVCRPGSVRVAEHKRLETYRNVHHLVSTVTGELDPGTDAVDLLRATFPGGSITGCPKIRAMEVIDELEPVRRHVYTGSIGYLGFDGAMDLSIAIRTATFTGDRAVFSVGGGIVIDSDAVSEFEETLHKGRTLMDALHAGGAERDEPTVWQDGAFLRRSAATVPVDSEGLAYGFGFFETLRVEAGRPVLLHAHVARFERAWRELFGGTPPDVTWADVIARLVERNGLGATTAVVKLVAAAGNAPGTPPARTLFASAKPYAPRSALTRYGGLRLRTYPHARHTHLADHKTLNHLHYRLAGQWADRHDADEAVVLNADGTVSETSSGTLCAVHGGTVRFATSEHALRGTTAEHVRRVLADRGFVVEDARQTVEDLLAADQVLVMNALMGVVPAVSLDGTALDADPTLAEELTRAVLGG
ncbi:aminodeoxychorismate synthase component I [Cellulomonas xiejunii]|uniref:aminodeoxychorismate synthase component I n=1 Tax=Cellulomonas xiejunii TaxID=2968083 RepID=UPI001D0EB484|nr:aminodeoxychorismate synthase component I [Cellulomonas xiejunii]MCC2314881.1 aminodeoxychorismate synthase component I [Cellulomonas xiejunii]